MKKHLENIPDLKDYSYEWAWNLHPEDSMSVVVYHWSRPVMCFFLGEALESAGYRAVMQHVEECNRTPWLTRWHQERQDEIVELLKKEYS